MPFLAAVFLLSGVGRAAETIPVRVAHHDNYTRIVFEFPRLLAYHVQLANGDVKIDFDTTAGAAIGPLKSPLVRNIKSVPNAQGLLILDIATVPGAEIKHYRLQRKVVVDVYAPEKMPAAPKAAAAQPAPAPTPAPAPAPVAAPAAKPAPVAAPVKQAAAPAPAPVAAPAPASPPPVVKDITPEKMKAAVLDTQAALDVPPPAEPPAAKPAPPPAPEPAAAAASPEADDSEALEGTKITFSAMIPSHMAMFERSNALWIVTDIPAGATLPLIEGPMAAFITAPQVLRFDGGAAYRYTFPRKFYAAVQKQGLSWQVWLLSTPVAVPPPVDMKMDFDTATRRAKLVVPFKGAGAPITFEDPDVGDTLYVMPTNDTTQVVQNQPHLTDVGFVPALMGMVIRPLKDGLTATPVKDTVVFTAQNGMTATPAGLGTPVLIGEADSAADDDNNRLFDFPNWRQGGSRLLLENRRALQDQIVAAKTPDERSSLFMKLAMLYFANNFGQEALGFLELVRQENPAMEKSPDFMALRGAANAMSGHYKEALQDFSYPPIQNLPEISLWTGYAAAATEQWHMADRAFPATNRLLLQYPDNIAIPFTIYMAESALRLGHTDTAARLLGTVNMSSDALNSQYLAAIDYLKGEALAQKGKLDRAEELWRPVARGLDRLYHTKASLALTRLLLQEKKISLKDAIDQIDSLRFAWRGDGLEVETLKTLGELKVQDGQALSGLSDMKNAADLADSISDDSSPIRDEMKGVMSDLFIAGKASKVPPLEAVSVYNEFGALLPKGTDGVASALNFADSLIGMDLLDKAEDLIEQQIKVGIAEDKVVGVGEKLAAVYLLDGKPQLALDALKKTERPNVTPAVREELDLLKARALSQLNQSDAAIAILNPLTSKAALRLKADVQWHTQNWNAAAATIESLLPPPTAALSDEDAAMVVNAAVAWKLGNSADKLKSIKNRYDAAMSTTKLASTFGVVTRDGGASGLEDHESMLKIAGEVDMFKGFLDAYKARAGKGG